MVLEDNLPPAKWALGRIVETHAGLDGQVRVVTVKTSKTMLKIAVLPTEDNIKPNPRAAGLDAGGIKAGRND